MEDDLNTPKALAVIWDMMKSEISDSAKKNLLVVFDSVLGLDLGTKKEEFKAVLPKEIEELLRQRYQFKKDKNWAESDRIRNEIIEMGYMVNDVKDDQVVVPK